MRLTLLFVLSLAACGSIVPSTALRLSGLSPMTADPAGFAVRMDLPQGIDIRQGGARLIYQVQRPAIGLTETEVVTLNRTDDVFTIASDDLGRLRAIQAQTRAWKAEDPAGTVGSLSVSLAPCLLGEKPGENATVSVFLRPEPQGVFLPLIRDAPFSEVVTAKALVQMQQCP